MAINVTDDKVAQVPKNNAQDSDFGHVRFATNKELEISTIGNENGAAVTPEQVLKINKNANVVRNINKQKNIYDQTPRTGDLFYGVPISETNPCEPKWYIYNENIRNGIFQSLTGPQGSQGIQGPITKIVGSKSNVINNNPELNPTVESTIVDTSNPLEKNINFVFNNIKGKKGDKGDKGNKGDKGDITFIGESFFAMNLNSMTGELYIEYPEGYNIPEQPPFFLKNNTLFFRTSPTNSINIGNILPSAENLEVGKYNLELTKNDDGTTSLEWTKKV